MRKSPTIKPRICEVCKKEYFPSGATQKYCDICKIEVSKQTKLKHYLKTHPNYYEPKVQKYCSACDELFYSSFEGIPYCKKHFRKAYRTGNPFYEKKKGNDYIELEDCFEMTTSKGEKFYIDKDDFEKVIQYKWCLGKTGYLVASVDLKTTKIHRFLLGIESKEIVDHIDGNPLNNRRNNLRKCTHEQNARNSRVQHNNKTGYPGVKKKDNGRYLATIMVNRKSISLGTYATKEEALKARIEGEQKYFKDFAPSLGVLRQYAELDGVIIKADIAV